MIQYAEVNTKKGRQVCAILKKNTKTVLVEFVNNTRAIRHIAKDKVEFLEVEFPEPTDEVA